MAKSAGDYNDKNKNKKFKKNEESDSDESNEDDQEEIDEDDDDGESEINESEEEDDDNQEEEEEEEEESDEEDDDEESEDEKVKKPTKKEEFKLKEQNRISSLKSTIKDELNQMTFEEIAKFQNKLGLKKFKEVMNQDGPNTSEQTKTFTRLNKNRPQELSSKKPVSFYRNVFQAKKQEQIIDPRFNSAFGEYKPEFFRKRYSFVNDMRHKEKETLGEQLKNETDSKKKDQIKSAITRLKQQIKSFDESEKKEAVKEKIKKQTMEDAKQGKRPHFVNKTEQKILELAEKYKELKKSGKIENFLAKKRKKQLGKDSRHLSTNNKNLHFK